MPKIRQLLRYRKHFRRDAASARRWGEIKRSSPSRCQLSPFDWQEAAVGGVSCLTFRGLINSPVVPVCACMRECHCTATFVDASGALGSTHAHTHQRGACRACAWRTARMKESPVQLRRNAGRVSGLLITSDGQVRLGGKIKGGGRAEKVIELME